MNKTRYSWINNNIKILIFNSISAARLPIIYIVSSRVHINIKTRLSAKGYLYTPTSFIAFLVGIIDGDWYIRITKTEKRFIAVKLTISIHIEDISLLNSKQSILKIRKLKICAYHKIPVSRSVFNKTELQEVSFPLLLHHKIFFLTKVRIEQFYKAMFIIKNGISL